MSALPQSYRDGLRTDRTDSVLAREPGDCRDNLRPPYRFLMVGKDGTRGGFSCQQREVRKGSFLLTAEQKQQKKKELDI